MAKKEKKRNNPYGANQYLVDPRQALFFAAYFDPKSDTFGNGLRSGLKAGFSEQYSLVLTAHMPTWLSEKVKELNRNSMLDKAERNLMKVLDLETKVPAMGAFGPIINKKTKKPIMVESTGLHKVQLDASKFVAERLGKVIYGKEGDDDDNKGPTTVNITQININAPGKSSKNAGDSSNGETIPRMASPSES